MTAQHPQELKFALYDLRQPPCADIHEAILTIDSMMYTLENGVLHSNERLTLLNQCDALGKYIRATYIPASEPAADDLICPCDSDCEFLKRGEQCKEIKEQEIAKEHDQRIRKDERDKVLDAVIAHCRERAKECPEDETYTDSEMDLLVEWIEESLRSQQVLP